MDKDSLVEFFRSKTFVGILIGIGSMLIAIVIFEVGVTVGYHEASFSERWGENYGQNFGISGSGLGTALPDSHSPTPDGTLGKIISISNTTASPSASTTTIIIASTKKPEQKVLIDAGTIIRSHENTMTVSQLTVGSSVVVLGTPNDTGEIEAKLVRVVATSP